MSVSQALAELLAEVKSGQTGVDLLVFQTIELEDIGHHIGQTSAGIGDGFGVFHALLLGQVGGLQQRCIVLHHGKRRLHFVRHIGNKIGAEGFHARQLLGHRVDGLAQ